MRSLGWCLAFLLSLEVAAPAIAAPPQVRATSYVLLDGSTGEVLASRLPDRRLPMASTTKVMTGLLALESGSAERTIVVPSAAIAIGESSSKLVAGEAISVGNLLKGLLVGSGNDAAVALASGLAPSQLAFVRRMNRRAGQLGLTNTRYANPHGLDQASHYSSTRDLITLSRVAMRRPAFRAIVANRRTTIPGPAGRGVRLLESENTLLSIDPMADGIKTGHTAGAGYSLVAHATSDELGVGLFYSAIGAPSEATRARDAKRILAWGFAQFAHPTVIAVDTIVARVPVRDRQGVTVEAGVAAPVEVAVRLGRPLSARIIAPPDIIGPVVAGARIGEVQIRSGEQTLRRVPLIAKNSVAGPGIGDRLRSALRAVA